MFGHEHGVFTALAAPVWPSGKPRLAWRFRHHVATLSVNTWAQQAPLDWA